MMLAMETNSQHHGTPVEGASVLVTGGNRGLGRALVQELLDRGAAKVYASSRAGHVATDERVVPIKLDVTDEASVAAAAQAARDVSIVINNAGVYLNTPILGAPLAEIQGELDANLFGLIRVTRAFAPALERHAPSALVNVLSVLSWVTLGSGYEVSKAAAWSATNAIRLQLAPKGVTVTGVHVGYMDTDMTAGIDAPKADPRDVASLIVDAIVAGDYEVLADDVSRQVRSELSNTDITALYAGLAA
jgi:NAD(P)-dependent dehydrogenase (short-subunit alcohol dehydrogenase family)